VCTTDMNQKVLIFSGNPKAASTWLGGLLTGISIEMGKLIFYGQYSIPENFTKIKRGKYEVIISQSSNYKILKDLEFDYKCIHVIRDPRDVCVSSYFSYKKTHEIGDWKQLADLRNRLNELPFEEGMVEIMEFNKYFFDQLDKWKYSDNNILELKYEEIIDDPEVTVIRMCKFLEIHESLQNKPLSAIIGKINRSFYRFGPLYYAFRIKQSKIPEDRILSINESLSFNKLARGRSRGEENNSSHYRKGIHGDWENYFNERLKKEFKERYGDLLVHLGYEKDRSW